SEHTFAIACLRCRSGPQTWEVSGQLQDLTLLLGGDDAQLLALEAGELRLKLENTLCRVIPALLESAGDQPVMRVDRLVSAFCQIRIIASALDTPPPLCSNGMIALFEVAERVKSELDCQRRDGGENAIGNGVVEQPEGQVHARMGSQRFSTLPGALIHRVDAAIAGIAHTEPASAFGAQQQTLSEPNTL